MDLTEVEPHLCYHILDSPPRTGRADDPPAPEIGHQEGRKTMRGTLALLTLVVIGLASACRTDETNVPEPSPEPLPLDPNLVAQGKEIFRFDTFGDETFWTDTLRMHEVIQSAVDPTTALDVGLKVDAEALPPEVVQGIQNGTIDLTNPRPPRSRSSS